MSLQIRPSLIAARRSQVLFCTLVVVMSGGMTTICEAGPEKEILVPPAPSDEPSITVDEEAERLVLPSRENVSPEEKEITVPPAPTYSEPSRSARVPDEEWTITIQPMQKTEFRSIASNYEKVYNSIPYRRSEYLANPSYRHDLTVEVLFGKMRNMVIHRNDTPERVVNPRPQFTQPYPISLNELDSYWPLLYYSTYRPPLLLPVE